MSHLWLLEPFWPFNHEVSFSSALLGPNWFTWCIVTSRLTQLDLEGLKILSAPSFTDPSSSVYFKAIWTHHVSSWPAPEEVTFLTSFHPTEIQFLHSILSTPLLAVSWSIDAKITITPASPCPVDGLMLGWIPDQVDQMVNACSSIWIKWRMKN